MRWLNINKLKVNKLCHLVCIARELGDSLCGQTLVKIRNQRLSQSVPLYLFAESLRICGHQGAPLVHKIVSFVFVLITLSHQMSPTFVDGT